jgi:hypothetical protein
VFRNPRIAIPAVAVAVVAVVVLVVAVAGGGDDTKKTGDSGDTQSVPKPPPQRKGPEPGQARFYREPSVSDAVSALRSKAGAGFDLVDAELTPASMKFQVRAGGRVAGYASRRPRYGELSAVKAPAAGRAYLAKASFGGSTLAPSLPQKLVAAVDARVKGRFRPLAITLRRDPYGQLGWTVSGTAGKRAVAYVANADGSGLRTQAADQKRQAKAAKGGGKPLPPREPISKKVVQQRIDEAKKIDKCVAAARGNQRKVRECNKKVLGQ